MRSCRAQLGTPQARLEELTSEGHAHHQPLDVGVTGAAPQPPPANPKQRLTSASQAVGPSWRLSAGVLGQFSDTFRTNWPQGSTLRSVPCDRDARGGHPGPAASSPLLGRQNMSSTAGATRALRVHPPPHVLGLGPLGICSRKTVTRSSPLP